MGVAIINHVGARLKLTEKTELAAYKVTYIAMHMHGSPKSMQAAPLTAENVVESVANFYESELKEFQSCGWEVENIWLDPGIGFGKDDRANLLLLKTGLNSLSGQNLVLGISRKSFIGRLLEIENPTDRDAPSKMFELALLMQNVKAIRTHDVKRLHGMRELLV